MLLVKNISKRFDDELVLDDVSFSVKKGEIVAIMGASGSGKTTLLRAIANLTGVDSGTIKNNKSDNYSKGLVSQKPSLFPWLSVKDNISYGLRIAGIALNTIETEVDHLLKATQLDKYADYLPQDISGGMKQRAALAASLATKPDLLLMDEPLSALDTQTRSHLRDFIRDILVEQNQSTIIVTHDPQEALYLADRIIILSPKPARIIDEVVVPFKGSRNRALIYNKQFQELEKYISYIMQAEAVRVKTDTMPSPEKHLSVGSNIWVGTTPLYYADEADLYKEAGIDSHSMVTLEWSSENRFMPVNEGLVDIMNMTLETAMVACEQNADLRILMPVDVSTGGDSIIARGGISSLQDLKNKKIGVETNWIGEFFLHYVLHKNGIKDSDVELVPMSVKDTPQALLSGRVDAIVTQEPWQSEIKSFSELNVLIDTTEMPIIYAVLVAKKDILEKKRESVDKFIKVTQEAISLTKKNPRMVAKKVAHRFGVSENHLMEQLGSLDFVTTDEYKVAHNKVDEIEKVLLTTGMLSKPFDRSKLLF
jgi:NitT/TauT family transport system ATP-binding protein